MTTKMKLQRFGRFLSNMVMPNIAAFIAWGLITALFIPTSWAPNATLAKLVDPMIIYLLPLLIGYTGGKLVAGERGAVVGAITTLGVITGADIPMFLGAMFAGPLGGLAIKSFDHVINGKVKSGFEMLVNNFSAGIIGAILAAIAYLLIGPLVKQLTDLLKIGVDFLVQSHLLPLTSIFVEPGKILFLNNAINHGIFTPLGSEQAQQMGYSIFFLIEANPGPGMGVLMAYVFFARGNAKLSAPGAAIIHFFGGIHEIYFPYVLMNPRLLLAVILGGISGIGTLLVLHAGLVAPASPGSIFAVLLMTPKGQYIGVISAVVIAFLVSFIVSAFLLRLSKTDAQSLASASAQIQSMKTQIQDQGVAKLASPDIIYIACDAGMGSSATGASILSKKIKQAGLSGIQITNIAINDLPKDAQIVITHQDLTARAQNTVPDAEHFSLHSFLDHDFYDELIKYLQVAGKQAMPTKNHSEKTDTSKKSFTLTGDQVFLGCKATNKDEAIRFVGEKLVAGGYVKAQYVQAMFEREKYSSTYLGAGIAIPHGTISAKAAVQKSGIVFCQYPDGVNFDQDGEKAYLVIGIAAKNDEHIKIIAALTGALENEETLNLLQSTTNVDEVLRILR